MANISDMKPQIATVPLDYPNEPVPGKIALLFNDNELRLYNQFSPYGYDEGAMFGSEQPYVWSKIGQRKQGYGRGVPVKSAAQDLVRVSKFIASGRGIVFLGTQFLLQGYQTYNETKIYNPVEVITAAASKMTMGILPRPQRHIDTSGGLLGALVSVLGFNSQNTKPPAGTMGYGALPIYNQSQGKGLLRAVTGTAGVARVKQTWTPAGKTGGGFLSAIGNYFKSELSQLVGGIFPPKKPEGKYRADEKTYDLMYDNNGNRLNYNSVEPTDVVLKRFTTYSPATDTPKPPTQKFISKLLFGSNAGGSADGKPNNLVYIRKANGLENYEDQYGVDTYNGTFKKSIIGDLYDLLLTQRRKSLSSTFTDQYEKSVVDIKDNLNRLLSSIKNEGYDVNFPEDYSQLISNPDSDVIGYDRIDKNAVYTKPLFVEYYNTANGLKEKYKFPEYGRVPTVTIKSSEGNWSNLGARTDGINRLSVLNNSKKTNLGSAFSNWTEWKPYEDDLIAFFFHDVVNDKYIPFRATVKGINESNNAMWDELTFIGRADRLYSYGGFTRNLSFSFQVVAGSIKELLPNWQRINYIASCVKPSNYTSDKSNNSYNRFMIPPMMMLTIGDLYKYQPIIITTVNVIVPENATWELLPESSNEDWSYLNGIFKLPNSKGKFAQFPMEAEISITCNLLEKERAIMGGNHYGHNPMNSTKEGDYIKIENVSPSPNRFSKGLRGGNAKEEIVLPPAPPGM
jgi:hypothetical protein